jgi:hypothetical protein
MYGLQRERLSQHVKGVPKAHNCLLKSMPGFGCDLSEKPSKNLMYRLVVVEHAFGGMQDLWVPLIKRCRSWLPPVSSDNGQYI